MLRASKPLAVILAAVLCASAAVPAAFAQGFVAGADDLPLMPGLTEMPGAGTVFDKPDGRIIEAYAEGRGIAAARVLDFYRQTLPQLGWQPVTDTIYRREAEELRLSIGDGGDRLVVRFDIAPR